MACPSPTTLLPTSNSSPDLECGPRHDAFTEAIVGWYRAGHRELPWRKNADAYSVWVSEIMLQQTTVAAVVPFYERWMDRFPTLESLASSDLEDVLRYWAGLGYYARARNLHRAAQHIVLNLGGTVPRIVEELKALPGVGRYTAGAIASIAFGQPEPIVDANVARVLSRVFGLKEDMRSSAAAHERLWRLAAELVPPVAASDFNQGVMELGAMVCSAGAPRCGRCPVKEICHGHQCGEPTAFPEALPGKRWLDIEDVSVLIEDAAGRFAILRRSPESPLWGGLWELPRVTREADETLDGAARRAAGLANFKPDSFVQFAEIKHVVANRRVTLHGYRAVGTRSTEIPERKPDQNTVGDIRWIALQSASDYPMASPQVRLLSYLVPQSGIAQDGQQALEF